MSVIERAGSRTHITLWDKAVGTSDYDKEQWIKLDRYINSLERRLKDSHESLEELLSWTSIHDANSSKLLAILRARKIIEGSELITKSPQAKLSAISKLIKESNGYSWADSPLANEIRKVINERI